MISELEINRAFYPPGFKSRYALTLRSSLPFLSELTDFMLRSLFPQSIWETGQLLDIKGIDPQAPRRLSKASEARSSHPNLLLVQGNFFHSLEPEDEDSEIIAEPFEIRLDTDFLSFQGFSHIKHKVLEHRPADFPDFLSLRDMGRVFPLEIRYIFCGLDLFRPRRFSSLLAFTPTVSQSMMLEASPNEFKLEISANSLRSKQELPMSDHEILSKLSEFLLAQTNFNLIEDYTSKVASPLGQDS